jgi:DNA-binding PadR family transcriptional regulator
MSGKSNPSRRGRHDRYIQPSILLGPYSKPSYGYEIIQNIQAFGFVEEPLPGMIYRHLRQMEEEGWCGRNWRRKDRARPEGVFHQPGGEETLALWMEHLDRKPWLSGIREGLRKNRRKKERNP